MATITVNLTNVQETLVSGTNIKTVNGTSLLGSGNIVTTDSSLGVADQSITDLARVVSLNTSDATSSLVFNSASGRDLFTIDGAGNIGIDNVPLSTSRMYLRTNTANQYALYARTQSTSGSNYAIRGRAEGVGGTANRALTLAASGATSINQALDKLYDKWMDYMIDRQFEANGI